MSADVWKILVKDLPHSLDERYMIGSFHCIQIIDHNVHRRISRAVTGMLKISAAARLFVLETLYYTPS